MPRKRPQQTRERLLTATYVELVQYGYQGASLDRILKRTYLSKGALYHHFKSKQALCAEAVRQRLTDRIEKTHIAPLAETDDPIGALRGILEQRIAMARGEDVKLDNQLNRLVQEMADLGDEFRRVFAEIYGAWRKAITEAITRGQRAGTVDPRANAPALATFIIAVVEGTSGLGKVTDPEQTYIASYRVLVDLLEGLRQEGGEREGL